MNAPLHVPPLPPRLQAPDAEAVRQLRLAVTTRQGREQAHQYADNLEQLVEAYEHNLRVGQEALQIVREALAEVAA